MAGRRSRKKHQRKPIVPRDDFGFLETLYRVPLERHQSSGEERQRNRMIFVNRRFGRCFRTLFRDLTLSEIHCFIDRLMCIGHIVTITDIEELANGIIFETNERVAQAEKTYWTPYGHPKVGIRNFHTVLQRSRIPIDRSGRLDMHHIVPRSRLLNSGVMYLNQQRHAEWHGMFINMTVPEVHCFLDIMMAPGTVWRIPNISALRNAIMHHTNTLVHMTKGKKHAFGFDTPYSDVRWQGFAPPRWVYAYE